MADIKLVGITKRFGRLTAVDGLTLDIRDREFLGIVGPSACGKTTLLRIIAGLERPDEGEVYIGGELANDIKTEKRNIQLVFQSYALWPHMKVFDSRKLTNISFPMKLRNWLQQDILDRVRKVNASVGVNDAFHDRKPDELSGGQQQRIALGRALVVPPKALLLDEPMSNLDPPSRVKIRGELRRIHDEYNMTTVIVTHNITDALAVTDRLAVMKDGKIVQIGTPREVYEHPRDSFVADFIRCYDAASALKQNR
ncbi:MAG: ABC transporter ATP-binding protein [Chloroflexi bacterium]|nr:ABC transporter ATP-binding protein [Chloroflexota bacterium]